MCHNHSMIPMAWPPSVFAFGISVPEKSWQMRISRDQDGKGPKERALWGPGLVNRGGSASYTGQGSAGWEKPCRLVWKAPEETDPEHRGVLRSHWEVSSEGWSQIM